jgi:hypothetical protein
MTLSRLLKRMISMKCIRLQSEVTNPHRFEVSFPKYLGAKYDASTTNLTYAIPGLSNGTDSVEVVLSFLSPITPTSTLRQAIPASYLTVHVKGDTTIKIYVDVNGQWVSGDRGSHIRWNFQQSSTLESKGLKTLKFQRDSELLLSEINDRAEWGTFWFTGPVVSVKTRESQKLMTIGC